MGYLALRRRFQLYHNPAAPTAAAARINQVVIVLTSFYSRDEPYSSEYAVDTDRHVRHDRL